MRVKMVSVGMLLVLIASGSLTAQPVTVTPHQPPPGQLQYEDLWWLDLDNTTQQTFSPVHLEAEVSEAQIGPVFRASSNDFDLPPGHKTIQSRDITVHDPWYLPGYEVFVRRTGTLPEGNYTYRITVMPGNLGSGQNNVQIRLPGVPQLSAPADGAELMDLLPMLTWTPPSPMPSSPVTYRLRIVEIISGQTRDEAMASNPSWFEQDGISITSLRYPTSAQPLTPEQAGFAWQVTALGEGFRPLVSAIWWFKIGAGPGGGVDLGQGEVKDATDLTQNKQTKTELNKILAKADTINKALKANDARKAMAWKNEMLKELNDLLQNAKRRGESDAFILKLQEARRKLEAEIAREKGAAPPTIDLGGGEIREAGELTQNSGIKDELQKIQGKFDKVNAALAKNDAKTAMEWKAEALKEINDLLDRAKRAGESDAMIQKLQAAKRKLEAEIAREKGTPPSGVDLGGKELGEAIDLTQNSQTKAELRKIIAKADTVNKALADGKPRKAIAWKQDMLREIDGLLARAKKQGESEAFIAKLQEARRKIQDELDREKKAAAATGPDLGGDDIGKARDLTQNSRTQAELDKILAKIDTIRKALEDKKEKKALAWKGEELKELNDLLGRAKRQGESDEFIKHLQDARRKIEAEIAREKGTAPAGIDLGGGEIRDASDLTQNSKSRDELKRILGKLDKVNAALAKKDAKTAMQWKQEALKEINTLLANAAKSGESAAYIEKLQAARKKVEDEIEHEK